MLIWKLQGTVSSTAYIVRLENIKLYVILYSRERYYTNKAAVMHLNGVPRKVLVHGAENVPQTGP